MRFNSTLSISISCVDALILSTITGRRPAGKWVAEDGNAMTLASFIAVDVEVVDTFRDAAKEKYKDSYLAGIATSDLTAFDAKSVATYSRGSLAEIDERVTLIVVVSDADDGDEGNISTFSVDNILW
ncbi:uncharacterized protein PHALS_13358 [Plasmopara halstedii]|uniref:Uncharacterized protein n=1 Tax=Plasmopara halstedii TaxID=4781 RepID=A0A0P1AQL2_PLAHL|nr:uncharacterized protein PHALS_13358 [Plasmopara halstedii]CEG43142.1 hypothetical protein PHALS_13358 [Plasmopara halstedii]|eukprot:XP_024579511.1 hypothetical protein PHALS_13358 [Plasmopara halstedii]